MVMSSITIPQHNIAWMVLTAVALFLLPVAVVTAWKLLHKKNISWTPLLIGAASFIVSARAPKKVNIKIR